MPTSSFDTPSESVFTADSTCGQGVFAARAFPSGEIVGWMTGQIVDEEHYSSEYCVDLGNGSGLEPAAPFRFLNHSCEPNCELYLTDEIDDDTGELIAVHVSVETCRELAAGEELTIDYGWPADGAIECRCGSEACRGWIVSPDELSLLQERQRRTAV